MSDTALAAGSRANPLAVAYRPLRDLVPYARNARTHSASQIAAVRASMAHYGWTNPMLIAGNEMIAGHARLRAALDMAHNNQPIPGNDDPWMGPTIDLSHLSLIDRRAYVTADNQYALLAGWDKDLLRADMVELRIAGFDMNLTGFSELEIDVLLGGSTKDDTEVGAVERPLSEAEQQLWDVAWRDLMAEWHGHVEAVRQHLHAVSHNFSPAALAIYFLRARFFGQDIPRGATFAFQPSRLFVNADNFSISEVFQKAIERPNIMESMRWQCGGKPNFDSFIANTMPVQGHRSPGDFPALLARDLIGEFCPPGGLVLDPCHGWGGRLIGFLMSEAVVYHGIDVSPEAQAGVAAMYEHLKPFCSPRTVQLDLCPYQEMGLADSSYDMALTSPPYFNTEKYDGERQSWREFDGFDAWVDGFYRPLLHKTYEALKPGGVFALQVGSQRYPLTRYAKSLGVEAGFGVEAIRATEMTNSQAQTQATDGEVVVVLRKPGPGVSVALTAYKAPDEPPGALRSVASVTVRRLETQDEAKAAIRVRAPWAGKTLFALPPVVYYTAMEEGRLYGAFLDDRMVGYMLMIWRKRADAAELKQMAVVDDAPNGVGRMLATAAWDWAVDRQAKSLMVQTLITNTRAESFYKQFGFIETGRTDRDINLIIRLAKDHPDAEPAEGPDGLGGEIPC